MNIALTIMTAVLLLTLFSPFGLYYGVKLAIKKDYVAHRKIQNIIFIVCVLGVLSLEVLIRYSGGSGSLASESKYYGCFSVTYFSSGANIYFMGSSHYHV